jgi:hypothetical protein
MDFDLRRKSLKCIQIQAEFIAEALPLRLDVKVDVRRSLGRIVIPRSGELHIVSAVFGEQAAEKGRENNIALTDTKRPGFGLKGGWLIVGRQVLNAAVDQIYDGVVDCKKGVEESRRKARTRWRSVMKIE